MKPNNTFIHFGTLEQTYVVDVSESRIGHCFTGEYYSLGKNKVEVFINNKKMKDNETIAVGDAFDINGEYTAVVKRIGPAIVYKERKETEPMLYVLTLQITHEKLV